MSENASDRNIRWARERAWNEAKLHELLLQLAREVADGQAMKDLSDQDREDFVWELCCLLKTQSR